MSLIMLFESLIGLTDVYIAGKVGKEIQAAYGFVIQLYFIFIVVANALTVGTVSVVSRLFTAGKSRELAEAIFPGRAGYRRHRSRSGQRAGHRSHIRG